MSTTAGIAPAPLPERPDEPRQWLSTLREHWPEYLMEATCLGAFMVSACVVAALSNHPASRLAQYFEKASARRAAGGLAMAATALGIFFSPLGKRSGAHMNPALTLTYFTLGKVRGQDALFYVLAQFLGGAAGVGVASALVGPPLAHSAVNYAVTAPGMYGVLAAFLAELLISMIIMATILYVSNRKATARYTPFVAAACIALFITFESPISGMSMNPARTVASAVHAGEWTAIWIYFVAPVIGMSLASRAYVLADGRVYCAKLHHDNHYRCIFRCGYGEIK